MTSTVVECKTERVGLSVLQQVQRAYEDRLEQIERTGGRNKQKLLATTLRSWVSDLIAQNTLLARAVSELEMEATSAVLLEARRKQEMVTELRAEVSALRRCLARKDNDVRGLLEVLRRLRDMDNCSLEDMRFYEVTDKDIFGSVDCRQKKGESGDARGINQIKKNCEESVTEDRADIRIIQDLQKENLVQEREIRRLNMDALRYEEIISNLKKEMSQVNLYAPMYARKDAEVMVNMCSCRDIVESRPSMRSVHELNVTLSEEVHALSRMCTTLDEQCKHMVNTTKFKDDIIKEMRKQLKVAKVKLQEGRYVYNKELVCGDHEFSTPRRVKGKKREGQSQPSIGEDHSGPRFDGSGDELRSLKSN